MATSSARCLGRAGAALARGHFSEALAHLRGAPRRAALETGLTTALVEAAASLGLCRYRQAAQVASRALHRAGGPSDLGARLRIIRAQALWSLGELAGSRRELRHLGCSRLEPLTYGRLRESQAYFAWREGDAARARLELQEARHCYSRQRYRGGLSRALGTEAGVARHAGRFDEALRLLDRRARLASCGRRVGELAESALERGHLLVHLGSWEAARDEIERAGELFRSLAHPARRLRAQVRAAQLDLAEGRLRAASQALAEALEAAESTEAPRERAELLLHLADAGLATGDLRSAERVATEALRLFCDLRDRAGESRARYRWALALVRLARPKRAAQEARRALRAAPTTRADLRLVAELVLGHALLSHSSVEARGAFARAAAAAKARPGLVPAVRIGQALADGARPDAPVVRSSLAELERFGDRRVLGHCQAALRDGSWDSVTTIETRSPADQLVRLVEAAVALAGPGSPERRFVAAMRAVRGLLPWRQCAVFSADRGGWLLERDAPESRPLPEDHVLRGLSALGGADAVLERGPGVGSAALAPIEPGLVLYLEPAGPAPAGSSEQAAVAQLAALLRLHGCRPEPAHEGGRVPGILGRCPAMQRVFDQIQAVAPSELTVHISGETGTGKEKVARALHELSRRRSRIYQAVNAATPSDELFEAELFGHVKGAFTGAVAERAGLVAEAEGGTLFLDEVADLSPRAQAKLLRFLQEREYRRLGETRLRRADVRIITASNTSLPRCVAEGRFRADLMYRLCGVEIHLPPLRERGSDVVLLARFFLERAARIEGRPTPRLSGDVAAALQGHGWPGNVRELKDEMHRLAVFARDGRLHVEDLSPALRRAPSRRLRLKDVVRECEREHIHDVLTLHAGNRTRAAQSLGITRQALLGKISRMGVTV